MRRAWAAATVLLLAMSLSACADDGVKAPSTSSAKPTPSAEPSESASESTSESATTEVTPIEPSPPGLPEIPAGAFNACDVVTPELISTHFGADAGQSLSQPSSLGDPNAGDCLYYGGDATVVIQATTRADQDLPESAYTYEGLPGAEEVPGADRGWAYVFPNQSGATVTSGLILVKGQRGLQLSIVIDGHPYDIATLQAFAQDVLANMG